MLDRRHFFTSSSSGIGALALASLFRDDGLLAAEASNPLAVRPPLSEPDVRQYDLKPGDIAVADEKDWPPELVGKALGAITKIDPKRDAAGFTCRRSIPPRTAVRKTHRPALPRPADPRRAGGRDHVLDRPARGRDAVVRGGVDAPSQPRRRANG